MIDNLFCQYYVLLCYEIFEETIILLKQIIKAYY